MASTTKLFIILFFTCCLFLQGTLAELFCESLPIQACNYAVASSGKRCVVEKYSRNERGPANYTCKTSGVVAEGLSGYIESDQCVKACGVNRRIVGMSSNAILTTTLMDHLCSPVCYENCPNILELYFNLAAREGVYLPSLCDRQKNPHRTMSEIYSDSTGDDVELDSILSGAAAAPAPDAAAPAPTTSPSNAATATAGNSAGSESGSSVAATEEIDDFAD